MKNPAEDELKKKKAESEKLFSLCAEKEHVLKELKLSMAKFQQRYTVEVSQKQAELNMLHAKLSELKFNKSHHVPHASQNSSGAETRVEGEADAYKGFNRENQSESATIRESTEVKRVYRKIASVIHPDKSTEGRACPLRTTLMAELNEAYVRNDKCKMQSILLQWKESPEAVEGEGTAAELERTHRAIAQTKRRILDIETEIAKIIASETYGVMIKAQEAGSAGRDILSEMSKALDSRIQDAKNVLLLRMYG
ncbi:MAG: hypothetical protein NT163_03405 [Chlorobiales bacterium]|nr:hypothetical protein [Chlorobiales bacterium]